LDETCALPPNVVLSPLSAVIRPPLVIVTLQSGVLTGIAHVFEAAPAGSAASCVSFLFESAYALIASAPGSSGPW